MADPVSYDAAFVERAIQLGRDGRSRAEIAVALDVSLERLGVWSRAHADFADALERAATESRAWWDRQVREAVWKDDVFHASIWSRVMGQRFGSASHRTPAAAQPEAPPRQKVRIEIPPNGREVRRPPQRGGD